MSKNQLGKSGKQFVDVSTILRNPTDRAKLQTYIDEVVRCKQKILDENESIRGLRESAVEELQIQPKMFNTLVSLFFNNNFEQKREEIEQIEYAIDALMQTSNDD